MAKDSKKIKIHRHDPLQTQMEQDNQLKQKQRQPKVKKVVQQEEYLDTKTSNRILNLVQEQQREIEKEDCEEDSQDENIIETNYTLNAKDSDADSLHLSDIEEYADAEDFEADIELEDSEIAIMEKFMTQEPIKQANLSDMVMSRINATQIQKENQKSASEINPRIVDVYTKLGTLLSRYKSGKLPKAFKIIPALSNWEDILFITNPQEWTANATFEATRMFVSNLKARMAQKFLNIFLLEKVREDIASTKKLNYHLYMAIKKSLYKPAAFFKGFLLPLCESGSCTLREAAIIGSVLVKVSVPMLHSAAALLKLAEMDYTGPNSVFIRILLDKKYALPFRVVDALVFHFIRFKSDHREMPVLWHQSFLVFAQRYKEDMTPEQKDALLDVLKAKIHPGITPDIRRELQNSNCRGDIMEMSL